MPGRCIDFVYGKCYRSHCRFKHDLSYVRNRLVGDAERDLHEARQKENLGAQPALNSNAGNTLRTHSSSATTPQATPVVPPGLGLEKSLSSSGGTSEGHATITIPLLDSVSVTLGPGFAVSEVVTGFESKTVIIKNIPSNVTSKKLRKTLESFGELKNLQIPDNRSSPGHTIIKATFTSHSHAENASKSLDGTKLFGTRITARLASQKATSLGKGVVRDGDVYLEFPAPCRTACIGFATLESAQHAIELANDAEMGQSILSAFLYRGAPTIATYNVKILGLPPDTTAQELIGFGDNEGIMLMKSNYQSLDNALKELQASLERYGELDALVVYSPPFMNQTVRAWAHFSSPAAADEACKILNNCRQPYFDHEPMHAEHVLSIQYRLPPHVFAVLRDNIRYLRACVHDPTNRCDITIRGGRIHDTGAVGVKLTAETLSNLTRLKSSFESILRGETVMMNNRIAWNSFFASASGALFVADLQARSYGVLIDVDLRRSRIRLYGSPHKLVRVRQAICGKIAGLDAQKLHTFPLDGNLVGYFINTDLLKLQQELGAENVYIDHLSLKIRGNQDALKVARLIIQHARQNRLLRRKHITNGCPVCLDEVSLPVTLDCGHTWCKQCLTDYLLAAVETKAFPLKCLGNEARCTEKVPLRIARTILSPEDFHNVAQASFLAYIHSRPTEFHYCPTPDCSQIYRTAPPGTALQCPSCLVRICTNCHSEYHEGTPCADGETEQGKLFDEWTSTRDVKKCPGCKTYIERDAGCNHMTCTRCRTHICWVCLQTFPQGDIVYDHMREAHGGIGL
ncbi:hypothetical protein BDW22DRAFT_1330758 [Trametopsis cervina]|nr:hypothetical protein BDW22DRAFT_1330758 [Trametopsis cervina]